MTLLYTSNASMLYSTMPGEGLRANGNAPCMTSESGASLRAVCLLVAAHHTVAVAQLRARAGESVARAAALRAAQAAVGLCACAAPRATELGRRRARLAWRPRRKYC